MNVQVYILPSMALGSTQPPIQWVLGVLSPGCRLDQSSPCSEKVKNTSTFPYVFMA
jgi:hypothetical protein